MRKGILAAVAVCCVILALLTLLPQEDNVELIPAKTDEIDRQTPPDHANAHQEQQVPSATRATDSVQIDPGAPQPLSEAIAGWRAEEEAAIARIAAEPLEETLRLMGSFDDTYLTIVLDEASSNPVRPQSLLPITLSRRWAKLLDELFQDEQHREAGLELVARQLAADAAQYRAIAAATGTFASHYAEGTYTVSMDAENEEGLVPLMYRMNTGLLLLGLGGAPEATGAALAAIDAMGDDANPAAAGYAADRLLAAASQLEASDAEARVLEDYASWRAELPETSAFASYTIARLPGYDSAARPGDRAVAMGAGVEPGAMDIEFEEPPIFDLHVSVEGGHVTYWDFEGNVEASRQLVEFLRQYAGAQ